jgi:predicted protein tyrosine phosphatase
MKILVLCDQGNNRSVTVASLIKYWPNVDVLSAGLSTNSPATLGMLQDWADKIIFTEAIQGASIIESDKATLWDIGPDNYPRPFNRQLLNKVRTLMEQHKQEYIA